MLCISLQSSNSLLIRKVRYLIMIKTLIKLKMLKFILIGGLSAAYAFKRYYDKKNEIKIKKDKKTLLINR